MVAGASCCIRNASSSSSSMRSWEAKQPPLRIPNKMHRAHANVAISAYNGPAEVRGSCICCARARVSRRTVSASRRSLAQVGAHCVGRVLFQGEKPQTVEARGRPRPPPRSSTATRRSTPTRRQFEVAQAMQLAFEQHDVRMIVTTGDNIYAGHRLLGLPIGGSGDEDDDWFFTFSQPYRYMLNRIPVSCIGNHDSAET